ncbi:MAG TPA: hypothetical protein VNX25_05320, partial [Verrucomicrobiae bacterium]|nr:hypothetical protein [Verrucomicrobiae bacterium]
MVKGMSIRKRISLAVACIFVVTTAATAFFSYENQLRQLEVSLADMPKNEISLFESMITADAEGLARAHIGLTRLD